MINSDTYWDDRFEEDWESKQGPAQSRFFARIAIENLPRWLIEQLQRQSLTLCDWGCAQGDGTDVWASYMDSARITGIDFSSIAIGQAANRYPAIKFLNENWLGDQSNNPSAFDVVFSSNTLEHFHKPYDVLKVLCARAAKAVALAIPYRELDRYSEHFYTFLPENIPANIGDGFRMVWARVIDCRHLPNTYWSGEQIILVFAKSEWVDDLGLTLHDLFIEQTDYVSEIASLNQAVADRDGQIASLNQTVADRDGQIASLNQTVADRDGQIASLNHTVAERDIRIADLTYSTKIAQARCQELMASTSWRITAPMRILKRLITAFTCENARYSLLKSIYWRLPERLQVLLNKPKHRFVTNYLRSRKGYSVSSKSNNSHDSLSTISWVTQAKKFDKIAIITCGFEFDELVNQRPINAAKHYSERGFFVIYVAWQWSPEDVLAKGCGEVFPNIIQVPLYEFCNEYNSLSLEKKMGHYVITMPARQFIEAVDNWRMKGGVVIYDIMDEWEEFFKAGQAPWYDESLEQELVLKADFISAVSPKLGRKFGYIRDDIAIIGNGYSPEVLGVTKKEIAGTNKGKFPVIGYFGHLTDAWFDWDLLFFVAARLPDYKFEIIGYGEPEFVRKKALHFGNIKLLGKIAPSELYAHVSGWQVGIIPFIHSSLSDAVDPIKIYEYLYFGLPVVVTGIDHLKEYPKTHFATKSDIVMKIIQAISDNTDKDIVDDFLKKTTWAARFDALLELTSSRKSLFNLYKK